MKKLLSVLMLFTATLAFAQMELEVKAARPLTAGGTTAGAAWTSKVYNAAQTDTTAAIDVAGWETVDFVLTTTDSGQFLVYYRPSYTGSAFFAAVLIDSFTTAVNTAGMTRGFPLPALARSYPRVQFVYVVGSNDCANSTADSQRFSAKIVRKR